MRKRIKYVIGLILLAYHCYSQSPSIEWQRSYGSEGVETANSIKATSDDGYVIAGTKNLDFFIVKIDAVGILQWQKQLGGSNIEEAVDIEQTTDGGYIVAGLAASTDGDVTNNYGAFDYWVVKLNALGDILWEKFFGSEEWDIPTGIVQTDDGGYTVSGYTRTYLPFGLDHYDAWIIKLDNSGLLEWQQVLGGTSDDYSSDIQTTADGGYIFTGSTSSADLDVPESFGGWDIWVAKLNANGSLQWQKKFGGNSYEYGTSIQQTSDQGYIVSGLTRSTEGQVTGLHGVHEDVWVFKINNLGTLEWQNTFGGSDIEGESTSNNHAYNSKIKQTSDGGYILATSSPSTDGDINDHINLNDYWVLKLSDTGDLQWQRSLGGGAQDYATEILQDPEGGYIVAGTTNSQNFHVTQFFGNEDIWVVKLSETLATNDDYKIDFSLFPNPVTDFIHLQASQNYLIDAITICDMTGKILLERTGQMSSVDVSQLNSGVYFLRITSNNEKIVRRFIKQ